MHEHRLIARTKIIEREIKLLSKMGVPVAVNLLEMAKLELLIKANNISESEIAAFCEILNASCRKDAR